MQTLTCPSCNKTFSADTMKQRQIVSDHMLINHGILSTGREEYMSPKNDEE